MSAHDSRVTVALSAEAERGKEEEEEEEEDERRKRKGEKEGERGFRSLQGSRAKKMRKRRVMTLAWFQTVSEFVIDFKTTVFLGLRNGQSNLSLCQTNRDVVNVVMNSSLRLKPSISPLFIAKNPKIKACILDEDIVNIRNKVGGLILGS